MIACRGMGAVRPEKIPGRKSGGAVALAQGINNPKTNWTSKKAVNRPRTRYAKQQRFF